MVSILFNLLKEIFLSLAARIAFKTVAERFLTRLIIYSLNKLKGFADNDLIDETVDDIIAQLQGKRLKVADDARK